DHDHGRDRDGDRVRRSWRYLDLIWGLSRFVEKPWNRLKGSLCWSKMSVERSFKESSIALRSSRKFASAGFCWKTAKDLPASACASPRMRVASALALATIWAAWLSAAERMLLASFSPS